MISSFTKKNYKKFVKVIFCVFIFFRESTYCTDLHLKPMSVIQIDLDQIIDDVIDEAMTLVLFWLITMLETDFRDLKTLHLNIHPLLAIQLPQEPGKYNVVLVSIILKEKKLLFLMHISMSFQIIWSVKFLFTNFANKIFFLFMNSFDMLL